MATINAVKKIVAEDFPAASRELILRLATVLNPFLTQSAAALNGGVTLKDNLKSRALKVDLPAGTSTKVTAWDLNERPTDVHIGTLAKSDGTAPGAAFSLHWVYENKSLHLTFIGLDAGTHHVATIVAQV